MANGGKILIELAVDDKGVYTVINRAGAALKSFQGTAERTAVSVKRLEDAHNSLSTKFRHLVTTLGQLRFAAMDVNDVFLRLPIAILKSAGELERTQVLMRGLSKELTDVGRAAEGIRDFKFVTGLAKAAPFELGALADTFVKLKVAGLDPANGSMQSLVDSVARFGGTGETLKRASVAIQQMSGKGVISMEELRQQLGEAVPTAMRDMADGMDMSMAKLAKIVSSGTLATGPALGKMFVQMAINNEGAAAEMMKTWSGMLSRLKTEWQLTTQFIADNGFGEAAKESVTDLTEMMGSQEFKKFAIELGSVLASATKSILAVAQALIKFRDEIGDIVKAVVAYKLVFSGIVPLARTITAAYNEKTAAIMRGGAVAMARARQEQVEAIQTAANLKYEQLAIAQKTEFQLAMYQKELASVKARNAAILAEDARMAAILKGNALIASRPGLQGRDSQASYRAELARKNTELIARERELARAIATTSTNLGMAQGAAAKHGAELARLNNVTKLGTAATAAAALGVKAFSGALALMGGWVGVTIIAITGLVWWWNKAGKAAEESAALQRRIALGISDTKDMATARDEQRDAERDLAVAKRFASMDVINKGSSGQRKKTEEDRLRDTENIAKASNRVLAAIELAKNAEMAVRESTARDLSDGMSVISRRADTKLKEETQTKINALEAERIQATKGMVEGSKEYLKVNKRINDQKKNALLEGLTTRIAAERAAAEKLNTEAGKLSEGAIRTAKLNSAKEAENKAEQLELELKTKKGQIDAAIVLNTTDDEKSGKGKRTQTPVERFINDMKEAEAGLRAMLPGLLSAIGRVDEVAVAKREIEEKLKGKDFSYKTKQGVVDPSDEEKQRIIDMVTRNAELKVYVDDSKKLADKINSMKTEYGAAVAFIQNPLGEQDGSKVNDFKDLLDRMGSTPAELADYAKRLNISVTEVNATAAKLQEGRNQSATIDLANAYRPVFDSIKSMKPDYEAAMLVMLDPLADVDETRTNRFQEVIAKIKGVPGELSAASAALLAQAQEGARIAGTIDLAKGFKSLVDENRRADLEMIQDDRERVRKTLESENELAARRAALIIENAQKNMVAIDQIALMQEAADQNAIVRAEKLRLATRTPLESMADDWQKSMNKMDDAAVQWSNGFIDMMVNAASTGKMEFSSLVKSILADTLKITLQKQLGDPLQGIMGAAGDWIKKTVGLGSNERGSDPTSAAVDSMSKLDFASTALFQGFTDLNNRGLKEATAGLLEDTLGRANQVAVTQTFTSSLGNAVSAVWEFVAALRSSGSASSSGSLLGAIGKLFMPSAGSAVAPTMPTFGMGGIPFADGGIMSSMGSMPLRKYAAGGIANSPQMAIFGEGSQNEAYVPLPDGRSIPVSMTGSAAPQVTVNVINQSGTQVGAQQGQPRFDGKQMILDVVLTAVNQPGNFRDGMKGAMR